MSRFRDDNIEENINDRKPPQNVDLEMCVLGGIMLEPQGAMPLVIPILRPEDFYLDGHGVIFELALDLYDRGIPPDSIALMDELRARGQVERVGGIKWTIKDGIVYDAKQMLEDVREMVRKAKAGSVSQEDHPGAV